jgi:hypothetical protein
LKKRLEVGTAQITSIKKEFSETVQVAKQANMSSNYNEQYSRKNNIKVFNFTRREKQNIRMFLCVTSCTNFILPFSSFLTRITLLFTSLLNKHTIKGLSSCSAGSLCIATTSLSSKVTFRSRLTKLIKS